MAEEQPSLHIDTDWKKQAQEEKRRLAETATATPANQAHRLLFILPLLLFPLPGIVPLLECELENRAWGHAGSGTRSAASKPRSAPVGG